MRTYKQDKWEIYIEKTNQISCTRFWGKYGGLSLYGDDHKNRYTIDHEDIHFVNNDGCVLIRNPYETDDNKTEHEYFSIHDYLFDRILATNQNEGIHWILLPKLCLCQ